MVQTARNFPLGVARNQNYSLKFLRAEIVNSQIYSICKYLLKLLNDERCHGRFRKTRKGLVSGSKVTDIALATESALALLGTPQDHLEQ